MSKNLELTLIFSKLAEHLYSFLPGSGAPVTFASIANEFSFLEDYWIGGSKMPAIQKLLENVYYHEGEKSFAALILRIVEESIKYRQVKGNPLLKEEIQELNSFLKKMNIEITELKNLKFLRKLPDKVKKSKLDENSFLKHLHPLLIEHVQNLFLNGHYSQSIFEGCKLFEEYIKSKSNIHQIGGKSLMSKVFDENNPILKINKLKTPFDKDEQEGFKFLAMGVMVGVRNPKAHTVIELKDPIRAIKYLSLISLIIERIEDNLSAP
jgi:uncharacterized protein (TIGR02391 family)